MLAGMEALDLARLQFGATTVYHFLFVPLTIGLSPLVAIMQTFWWRTGDQRWYQLTRFFGKLLLINFAIGVATGIVQEFQFGMNWSEYSRFVGDVFGAPLAIEGLAAFFLESTFLGLWIFGWDRLPRPVHLACAWAFAIGTWLSAYFIIAANSFMQHPVGVRFNPETGRAELNSISTMLTNPTTLAAFPHVIAGALLTAGTFVAGIAAWWMVRSKRQGNTGNAHTYRKGLQVGLVTLVISGIAVIGSGDAQAKMMFQQQPMKMAAAEGLCHREQGAAFSLLTVGDLSNDCENVTRLLAIPNLTSWLAQGDFGATIDGVTEVQHSHASLYANDDKPPLAITYWSFRLMIGFAAFCAALALAGLWLTRRQRLSDKKWLATLGLVAIPMPFLANSFGWIFTEMGRQPWVVAPNPTGNPDVRMLVSDAVSGNPAWMVATSLIGFTLLYGVLAVFWVRLIKRYTVEGLPDEQPPSGQALAGEDDQAAVLHFAY